MTKSAREISWNIIRAYFKNNTYIEISLDHALKENHLSEKDVSLVTIIVYGVLQNLYRIDFVISKFSSIPIKKIQPQVLHALRIGIYQILFLDKIPDSAAVNETVKLVRKTGNARAAGFTNAVLRNLIRADYHPEEEIQKLEWLDRVSLLYSHPKWICERLEKNVGRAQAEDFLAWNNQVHPITIHTNALKTDPVQLTESLTAEGIRVSEGPFFKDSFQIVNTRNLAELDSFQKGWFRVQDSSSRLASQVCADCNPKKVLDLCAAPGGKSFSLYNAMLGKVDITACDLYPAKVQLMDREKSRLGYHNIRTQQNDAMVFNNDFVSNFDLVIADVPCSGLGVISKKPEIRYHQEESFEDLLMQSRTILDHAAQYVQPGGHLVFSTCTVLPEENDEMAEWFVQNHPDFEFEPFTDWNGNPVESGRISLWPQIHQTDGFYIAKFRRL